MAQAESKKPDAGDLFPNLQLNFTDGTSMNVPEDLSGRWGVLLLYRGQW